MDVLWDFYIYILKNVKKYGLTAPRMIKNKEFLKLVQNRNAYIGLPEESRLASASIPQDEATFVQIMGKHQKYAQNEKIYENVYAKMKNPQLKG